MLVPFQLFLPKSVAMRCALFGTNVAPVGVGQLVGTALDVAQTILPAIELCDDDSQVGMPALLETQRC